MPYSFLLKALLITGSFLLLINLQPTAAQTLSGPNRRSLQTSFERDVNRYRWAAGFIVDQRIAAWQLQASNQFSSDAFILFNDLLSFRDENILNWSLSQPNQKRLRPRFKGHLAWFSQSRVLSQDLYASTVFRPAKGISVEPSIGIAIDQRPGALRTTGIAPLKRDAGPAFGGRISISPDALSDYQVNLDAGANTQIINPRRGRQLSMRGRAERLFDQTRLASTISYSNFRRDAYQAVSFLNRDATSNALRESIEATTSDTLFVGIELESPFTKSLQFTSRVDFSANNRKIRTYRAPDESLFFDTDFSRRSVDAEVGLLYEVSRLTSWLTITGGAEVEQRQLSNRDALPTVQATQKGDLLEQADYDRSFLTVRWRNRVSVTNWLMTRFEGAASILRHDTPVTNQDDRDEAFYTGQFGLQYIPNPYLQASLDLYGTYYHTVYLKARRSAENNVQRSLRLRPSVIWTPTSNTYWRLSSEVRATYTVDDFLLEGRRPTDQSAREIQYDSELKQDLGNGFEIVATGGLSDLRLGRFLSDSFAEIPFDTLRTYSGWIKLRSQGRLDAEIGVRLFVRSDFERAANVRYRRLDEAGNFIVDEQGNVLRSTITRPARRWIEQVGPTFAITWPMKRQSALRLDGWLNIQHIRQRLYGDLPEALATHIRDEAIRGSRKIIPNLSISVLWNL